VSPKVLVCADIHDLFVPLPDDLLVNLKDSRPILDQLLDSLGPMFANTRNVENCLGPALTAAYRVMGHIGGKMVVLTANLPTLGEGRLKHREDLRALGTEREHTLLNAEDPFYRTKAVRHHTIAQSYRGDGRDSGACETH
jgi:protein transport protein SEC24